MIIVHRLQLTVYRRWGEMGRGFWRKKDLSPFPLCAGKEREMEGGVVSILLGGGVCIMRQKIMKNPL
jgi:hypothetical protein